MRLRQDIHVLHGSQPLPVKSLQQIWNAALGFHFQNQSMRLIQWYELSFSGHQRMRLLTVIDSRKGEKKKQANFFLSSLGPADRYLKTCIIRENEMVGAEIY